MTTSPKKKRWPLSRERSFRSLFKSNKSSSENIGAEYSRSYLDKLPVELIEQVLKHLVLLRPLNPTYKQCFHAFKDFFNLSYTCHRLYSILSQQALYETVVVYTKHQAMRLRKCLKHNQQVAAYIKTFCYIHPQDDDLSTTVTMGHAGYSYSSLNATARQMPCPDLLLELVALMPNLQNFILDEIGQGFKFPQYLHESKALAQLPTKLNLHMAPELGWTLSLRYNSFWPLGQLGSLHLSYALIDDNWLKELETNSVRVTSLALSGCKIRCDVASAQAHAAFDRVADLVLVNLRSISNVEVAYNRASLRRLTIGLCGRNMDVRPSKCQYLYPALSLLPAEFKMHSIYHNQPHPAHDHKPLDLGRLGDIFDQLAELDLETLTLVVPLRSVVPEHDPHYVRDQSVLTHLHRISQLHVQLVVPGDADVYEIRRKLPSNSNIDILF